VDGSLQTFTIPVHVDWHTNLTKTNDHEKVRCSVMSERIEVITVLTGKC